MPDRSATSPLVVCALVGLAVVLAGSGCGSGPRGPAEAGGSASPTSPSVTSGGIASTSAAGRPASTHATACTVFPADNIWHADISRLPVDRRSARYVASMGASTAAHPDFGSGLIDSAPFGIPITTVSRGQARVKVTFEYADESDPGPYPVPANAKVEGGAGGDGDRHVILFDPVACQLYELYRARPAGGGSWRAGSGARYDLRSNKLRPAGWTSADAAGLPIMAGLVRYDEVAAGRVDHAIRVTASRTRNSYVWPARHAAGSADQALPPMGTRFRLKASVRTAGFPRQARVIAEALKRYGAILADNGSSWYFSGTQDDRWDNSALAALKSLRGSDFEAVDTGSLMVDRDSAAIRAS